MADMQNSRELFILIAAVTHWMNTRNRHELNELMDVETAQGAFIPATDEELNQLILDMRSGKQIGV